MVTAGARQAQTINEQHMHAATHKHEDYSNAGVVAPEAPLKPAG